MQKLKELKLEYEEYVIEYFLHKAYLFFLSRTERSIFDDINKTISNLLQQEQRTVPNRENTNQDLEESKDQVVFEGKF